MNKEEQDELYYQLALTFVPGIGARTGRALLDRFDTAAAIFKAPLKELCRTDGVTETRAKGFRDDDLLRRAAAEVEFVIKHNVKATWYKHNYPRRLNECSDAPQLLFYKGNADLDALKIVAIVGTRKNTDYGAQLCEELVEGLQSLEDVLVVSGLAMGIDAVAHRKCVQLGIPTVGVLGHGIDTIYPFTHRGLATQMEEHGGILTEFISGTTPERNNFPMRNRIVAGLSDVTVVVESNKSGGALITARMASSYNRDVAAYPGRVSDTRSAGCNELIRTNEAALITGPADLVDMMSWADSKPKAVQRQLFVNFSPEEQKVVDLLQAKDSVHADELYHHTGFASSILAATLLQLEMQGLVRSLPGKLYRMA